MTRRPKVAAARLAALALALLVSAACGQKANVGDEPSALPAYDQAANGASPAAGQPADAVSFPPSPPTIRR
ncbi:MAG TPA: hypothetical protein VHA75_04260, partial [Rugosimonospora sp.]|nr:hypothetical protein [Rugosimonospora sp.]